MTQRDLAKQTLAEFILWARKEGEITTDDDGLDGTKEDFEAMADRFLTVLDKLEADAINTPTGS